MSSGPQFVPGRHVGIGPEPSPATCRKVPSGPQFVPGRHVGIGPEPSPARKLCFIWRRRSCVSTAPTTMVNATSTKTAKMINRFMISSPFELCSTRMRLLGDRCSLAWLDCGCRRLRHGRRSFANDDDHSSCVVCGCAASSGNRASQHQACKSSNERLFHGSTLLQQISLLEQNALKTLSTNAECRCILTQPGNYEPTER